MKHAKIKAVTFDAYGTLVKLEKPFQLLVEALMRRGYLIPEDAARAAFSEEMAFYKAHHMEGRDAESLLGLREKCSALLFDRLRSLGYPTGLGPLEQLEILMESIRFAIFPDVIPALEWCSSAGLKTAVVSNWDCSLPETLAELFADHCFESVIVSAIEGVDKSGCEIFLRAATALGEPPSAILHVGDDPLNDLESPAKAGLQTLLIEREKIGHGPPGRTINSLEEITRVVPALQGR